MNKTSPEIIKKIIELYTSGTNSEKIAKQFNLASSTICRILKRNNVEIRPAHENKRKLKLNENYFENIDSEDKAYLLGFMFADGSIKDWSNQVTISLHHQDKHILDTFSNIIYLDTNQVKTYKNKNGLDVCNLATYHPKIKQDLINLGCIPDKTFIIRFPNINENMYRHFIRGFMDGDGCICITNNRCRLDFTSTFEMLNDILSVLRSELNLELNNSVRKHNTKESWSLQFSARNDVMKILDWLYTDSNYYLTRKYEKYKEAKEWAQKSNQK